MNPSKLIIYVLATILFINVQNDIIAVKKNTTCKHEELKTKSVVSQEHEFRIQEHLKPSNLEGISEEQIRQHWELYKGYVSNTNQLNKEIQSFIKSGTSNSLDCSDRRRRYGFEYNGMVLHEYYFGNLAANIEFPKNSEFIKAIGRQFGSFEKWKEDFINAGKTRGIGWAILNFDPASKTLINIFVADHEIGNIAGFCPILVMDIWEHAYMVDYEATERPNYITAFMKNVNWLKVENRYKEAMSGKLASRY